MSVSANFFGWIVEFLHPPVRNELFRVRTPKFLRSVEKKKRDGHPRPFRNRDRIYTFSRGCFSWSAQWNDVIFCRLLDADKGQQIRCSCEGMRGRPFVSTPEGVHVTSASHAQRRRGSVARTSSGPKLGRCSRMAAIHREACIVVLAGGLVR